MTYLYRVTFVTKKGGYKKWNIDIEQTAPGVAFAEHDARTRWVNTYGPDAPHMFQVKARRLKDEEEFLYHWFKKI